MKYVVMIAALMLAALAVEGGETPKVEPAISESVRLQTVVNFRNAQNDNMFAQSFALRIENLKLKLDVANAQAAKSSAKFANELKKAVKDAGYPEGSTAEIDPSTEKITVNVPDKAGEKKP